MGEYRIVHNEEGQVGNKQLFLKAQAAFQKRDFKKTIEYLESIDCVEETCSKEALNINKALIYHILGEYDKAEKLYVNNLNKDTIIINYLACCHRYFQYKKLLQLEISDFIKLPELYNNNMINYEIATNGIFQIDLSEIEMTIFLEQILNDIYIKMGLPILHACNDILKNQFIKTVEVEQRKHVHKKRKKVGIFVTDIQRHKDSAIIFELVEILRSDFDVYIYFNNIFANKLAKSFEKKCEIRYVINKCYEEINNIFFEDEIDILIDLAGYGLRNNNIALCFVENRIQLYDLLKDFPILLQTNEYYPENIVEKKEQRTCILGDFRCVHNEELLYIKENCEGQLIFESHSFDEELFKKIFINRLVGLGFEMSRVEVIEGILPFKSYMDYLCASENIVLTSGASFVELSEAVKSGRNVLVISNNKILEHFSDYYGIATKEHDFKLSNIEYKKGEVDRCLRKYIHNLPDQELFMIKNKNSRVSYWESGKEYSISNTCNGDIVVFDEGL